MGYVVGRCDVLDILEESAVFHRPIVIDLEDGSHFEDKVKDVVTHDGEDFAVFEEHETTPVSKICDCCRAEPFEHTYAGLYGPPIELQ
jgi:transcriptional antiterminator Rof (Rho-off)